MTCGTQPLSWASDLLCQFFPSLVLSLWFKKLWYMKRGSEQRLEKHAMQEQVKEDYRLALFKEMKMKKRCCLIVLHRGKLASKSFPFWSQAAYLWCMDWWAWWASFWGHNQVNRNMALRPIVANKECIRMCRCVGVCECERAHKLHS